MTRNGKRPVIFAGNRPNAGDMKEDLKRIRASMALLQQNAEGCALNHYGEDSEEYGMPGWLFDTEADLDRLTDIILEMQS